MHRVSGQNDTTHVNNDSSLSDISHNGSDLHSVSRQSADIENQVKEDQAAKPEPISEPGTAYEEDIANEPELVADEPTKKIDELITTDEEEVEIPEPENYQTSIELIADKKNVCESNESKHQKRTLYFQLELSANENDLTISVAQPKASGRDRRVLLPPLESKGYKIVPI